MEAWLHPLPQKQYDEGRTIYLSANNFGRLVRGAGYVQLSDFDCAVKGNGKNNGAIQVDIYRAPEVILQAGYSYSADIWNLGVMLWDWLEGSPLFTAVDTNRGNEYDDINHLALITALFGPPPDNLLRQGERTDFLYDDLKEPYIKPTPNEFGFEQSVNRISGEEKEQFIKFARRMIKWQPDERSTAKELLKDPWLDVKLA
ncbi:predicted protein [Uncinocarpus reesii 1704]|uniref:Protein kinase domain-containing protein n=1 Tax=Uncinocarpus reesii (strain UAMH 1704) TaxID=336963 RepID=C4JUM3_UNCRE|nr:uncharacterized protein UREG_04826 [Uncinocarpus reesii 1704]EEP79984.1 predicted protein [Uncinocarpus reesii 1704]